MSVCDESKPYIFISYAHKDAEVVINIINRLNENGYNVWWDEGIDPGTEWDENIAEHVRNCAYFIGFVSENYINSKNCKDEVNYSRDLDKNQLLVYLDQVELPGGMAMRMNRIQSIFWFKYETEDASFAKLLEAKGIEVTKLGSKAAEGWVPAKVPESYKKLNEDQNKKISKKSLIIGIAATAVVAAAVICILLFKKPGIDKMTPDQLWGEAMDAFSKSDYENAEKYWLKLKELGDGDACDFLGNYYFDIQCDPQKALDVYEEGYEIGSDLCANDLANLYYTGIQNVLDSNIPKAVECAAFAHQMGNDEKYEEFYNSGYNPCYSEMGKLLMKGNDKIEPNYGDAMRWLSIGSEIGDGDSSAYEALLYRSGSGVTTDIDKAVELFNLSIEQGSPLGAIFLGGMYKDGEGVDADAAKAKSYYETALNMFKEMGDEDNVQYVQGLLDEVK